MLALFKILVGVAVPLASFALGLQAPRIERNVLREQRSLILRSLFAILVVVPIATVLFAELFRLPDRVKTGLIFAILAVGIGPPMAFQRMKATDPRARSALLLNLVVMISSIAFVPLAYALYGALAHMELRVRPVQVAELVLTRALIPLALGMAAARFLPRFAGPAARWSALVVKAATALMAVLALVATWRVLLEVGGLVWFACAAVALGGLAIGHAMGGPDRETRGVAAVASAKRFPVLALLLAAQAPDGRQVIPVVLVYIICSFAAVTLYGALTTAAWRPPQGAAGGNR